MESVLLALELVGSDGGSAFWELEKILRDVKLLQIYEGTNELNRLMIYKSFAGPSLLEKLLFKESSQ
jgi:acyl-CoA dehydrogenase